MRTKFSEIGEQFALCVNLPAVTSGEQLLALMYEIRQEMKDMRQEMKDMRQEMKDMRQEMKDIRQETKDMRQETKEIRGGVRRLEGRIDGVEKHLREQEVRNTARDVNSFARFLNSRAVKPEDQLSPFRALETNREIDGFPQTVSEMDGLSSARANAILRAVQEPVDGDLTQRRRRLKLFTGVLVQAV